MMSYHVAFRLNVALALGLVLVAARPALAQVCVQPAPDDHVAYIGRIEPNRVLLAWGTTGGRQTIGYDSPSDRAAEVWIDGALKASEKARNWVWVDGLAPDRTYEYTICLGGFLVRQSRVRTYPVSATRLTFFVIGDYGNGKPAQRSLAAAMTRALRESQNTESPARFVLTTGDNIYRSGFLSPVTNGNSGDRDSHWQDKFFGPYSDLIASIPFLPSVGNHDRGETEKEDDLRQYYDNFLFPPGERLPYYTFTFGGLAQFFALNTSSRSGRQSDKDEAFGPSSMQRAWLANQMANSSAPWKIPYFHHPPFTAGPDHADEESRGRVRHLAALFDSRVKVAFAGHEHNFQFSEASLATQGVRYIVTGSGGQLDGGFSIEFPAARIEQGASVRHFLRVDIDGDTMTVTLLGENGEILPLDRSGQPQRLPTISLK